MRDSGTLPAMLFLAILVGATLAGLMPGDTGTPAAQGEAPGGQDGNGPGSPAGDPDPAPAVRGDNSGPQEQRSDDGRSSQSLDRDVAIIGPLKYQGIMDVWGTMGAAKVGRNTEFNVDLRNLGVQVGNVPVEFTVYDSLGGVEQSDSAIVESMTTGQDSQVIFTWKPLRSGVFSTEARVTLQDLHYLKVILLR